MSETSKVDGEVTKQGQIPKAGWYVCCTDSFMSGWGPAKNRTNRLIFPCESYQQAMVVAQNAKDRTDMKNVRVCTRKPNLRDGVLYQVLDQAKAPRWYEDGRPFRI